MSGEIRQGWLSRLDAHCRRAETALLTILLCALIAIAFGQIVLRNVFATGVAWADGSAQLLVLWIAVIGALAATSDRRHISINLASRYLPPAWHRRVLVIVDVFAAAVAGVFAWQALRFVADAREFGDVVLGGLPAWPVQAVLPVGFALITIRFLVNAAQSTVGRR